MDKRMIAPDEVKQIEISILKEIEKICIQNGWKYLLMYGAFIGAVRHKGFIPWDDDIDIVLERSEYDKLIAYLRSEQNTCQWLGVLDSSVPGYYYPFAKVVDTRTVAKMTSNTTAHGVWVDVFPHENVPDTVWKANLMLDLCYLCREITIAMTTDFSAPGRIKENEFRKRFLWLCANIIGKKNVCRIYEFISKKYRNKQTTYVGTTFSPYRRREKFNKELLRETKKYTFENTEFVGPAEYDAVLTQLYGNYMELPPEEKRRSHNVVAWYL